MDIILKIECDVYTDTRMGASNPNYILGYSKSTDGAIKIIKKYFRKEKRRIDNSVFNNLKVGWSHDFRPEIISVGKIKVED